MAASARRYSFWRSPPASRILISIDECNFSQMRGTARNSVGAISRRSSCTVRRLSAKLTTAPERSGRQTV